MRYTAIAVLTLGLSAFSLEAQKRCVKGIPCGNTCIAANKTCRIGTPSGSASGTSQLAVAAAPVAVDYRFIVYERADGRLLLQAVREGEHVAADNVLSFELSQATLRWHLGHVFLKALLMIPCGAYSWPLPADRV